MKYWLRFVISVILAAPLPAGIHQKPAPATAKAKKKLASRYGSPRIAKKTSFNRSKNSRSSATTPTREPARQLAPSNDRYREIQEALAAKGYLATPPTGQWDQDSQDAMRRFQADQKLDSSGKLTARSIIALGLGSPSAALPPSAAPAKQ